jgi:hypothetical protein
MRQCFLIIAALLLFMGCSDSAKTLDVKPAGARLSPREVIEMAKRAGEHNGMKLDDYKKPEFSYRATKEKTWSVFFDGRVPMHGNHFMVVVDDQTGEAHYVGGR